MQHYRNHRAMTTSGFETAYQDTSQVFKLTLSDLTHYVRGKGAKRELTDARLGSVVIPRGMTDRNRALEHDRFRLKQSCSEHTPV